jgi:hypothetical protein
MTQAKREHPASSWVEVVKSKRAAQLTAVTPFFEQELPLTDPITNIDDVEKLALKLKTGELKAEHVILAYVKR